MCFRARFHRAPQQKAFTTEGTEVTGGKGQKLLTAEAARGNLAEFAEDWSGAKLFAASFAAFLCDLCG